MRVKHLNELILRVERASGSRQDLCTEGIMTILMNCLYYVDILDRSQRKRKKNDKASILQLNLFLGLISSDMIVLVRLLSILQISACMKFHWLAKKTLELKEYGW